jgi:response regulator RpfG family c-di-GMP phosphodiesterase
MAQHSDQSVSPVAEPAVLVVDDELGVRDLMVRWLEAAGHVVVAASSADEALARAAQVPIGVALCDIRMPGRDGLWLAEQIRQRWPDTAVVMATGVQDVGSAVASLRHGVIDYLMKPFGRDRLREAVQRGLEWHREAAEARASRDRLEQALDERRARLAEALRALRIDSREALEATLVMLTMNDPRLLEHSRRVAGLAADLGRSLDLPADGIDILERAALVHDLPRLVWPEALVRKPGPLSPEEEAIVKAGPEEIHTFLSQIPYLARAAELVRARHERWDGTGYPHGLRAAAIPLGSRILAVVDTYDTLCHPRWHRPAVTERAALDELRRSAGRQFDPDVVETFCRLREPSAASHA